MKYTKSEFYKLWLTRNEWQIINAQGYPDHLNDLKGDPITTEEQWDKFLETQPEIEEFVRLDEDAANFQEVPFAKPYDSVRQYPRAGDQLDAIYKALLSVRSSGIDLGSDADAYLDSITAVKTEVPKNGTSPAAPVIIAEPQGTP